MLFPSEMYFGKVQIERVNEAMIEGVFYWPIVARCTENDQTSIMDLFIVWRYINHDHHIIEPGSQETYQIIQANIETVTEKWLSMNSNSCLHDQVAPYTLQMLRVIIDLIWEAGMDIQLIRKYYPIIMKAARDIEELTGMGFKKMIYSKSVVIPITLEIDGILRKRPMHYLAISVFILNRKNATIAMLQDFEDIKSQVQTKERVYFFKFLL